MPLVQYGSEDSSPRVIQIAGAIPGLTSSEVLAPASTPAAPLGTWVFDFSDPDGPQMGTVAMGPNNAVHLAVDPVVIVSSSSSLGLSLSNNVEAEVLILIDRADTEFQTEKFYAFADSEGDVSVRWYDELPPGHSILGKVAYVSIPFLSSMEKGASGFAEDDDGFNF
mmetsp:Transcript_10203/g.17297  ORF Transcript_10203/g.17297 Transcript_10203/m.17297 type:complete len:167 (+) Transcript_10203:206-706(+)